MRNSCLDKLDVASFIEKADQGPGAMTVFPWFSKTGFYCSLQPENGLPDFKSMQANNYGSRIPAVSCSHIWHLMSSILNITLLLFVGFSNLGTFRNKSSLDNFHNQESHVDTVSSTTNYVFFLATI